MRKTKKALRKIMVGLIGFPLLVLGIILVPLPGPGVLVSLVAFFILSLEFTWAERGLQESKAILQKIYQAAKERAARLDDSLKE